MTRVLSLPNGVTVDVTRISAMQFSAGAPARPRNDCIHFAGPDGARRTGYDALKLPSEGEFAALSDQELRAIYERSEPVPA